MFRAPPNVFDELVAKTTDENLTSENWDLILTVCEKVQEDGTKNGKEVVGALIKRLTHRNANVQLYTLELANSLVQNCGQSVHRELASRSFTDKLIAMAGDRTTHPQVKTRILERMQDWTREFSSNPDLGIMGQAFQSLKSKNLPIVPPSKPQKTEISASDRRREEEELQMALALSIQESQRQTGPSVSASRPAQQPQQQQQQQQQQYPSQPPSQQQQAYSTSPAGQPPLETGYPAPQPAGPSGGTAATVSRVRALFDFTPTEQGELQFSKGDIITVLESVYKDWWRGSLRGQVGIFPLNYVEKLADPTRAELEKEAAMEAEVFGEMRNVEKLLALLSTSGPSVGPSGTGTDSDEISQLYHQTLAIRPKLIELIGKYAQKKDEFTQLNEKFIKARREYESLLEASMMGPSVGARQPYVGYSGGNQRPQSYAPAGQPTHSNSAFHVLAVEPQNSGSGVAGQPAHVQPQPQPQQQQQQPQPQPQPQQQQQQQPQQYQAYRPAGDQQQPVAQQLSGQAGAAEQPAGGGYYSY